MLMSGTDGEMISQRIITVDKVSNGWIVLVRTKDDKPHPAVVESAEIAEKIIGHEDPEDAWKGPSPMAALAGQFGKLAQRFAGQPITRELHVFTDAAQLVEFLSKVLS